jgi:radical SAM superfamily enzyme YgiQ (UPF0313 family)
MLARTEPAPCRVLLVYPRFVAPSFWNFRSVCELMDARYPTAPLGLITVAGMLPKSWELRLADRNVDTYADSDIDWADLVITTGMLPQQSDTLEVIRLCRAKGKPVAVGGPDVTSSPQVYTEADFRVLGEAELVIDDFIAAWDSGQRQGVFEAEKFKADVTSSPIPRFDLLDLGRYLYVGVQYSRGCPFNCEFCDIIELYGRVPRTKTNDQMLAELNALYDIGHRGHVDFVDDNFIGNKKAIKQFLPHLIAWQKQHGYPFEFSTEASINLADDEALLGLMRDANFFTVFVGIESPDTDTLVAMQKKQNTRRSLADSVKKIYANGIYVNAGFILGFDSEKGSISQGMTDCIEDTAIPVAMIGLLYALPNTQLTRRLAKEGRLYAGHDSGEATGGGGDQCTEGLNFDTQRPRREILLDYIRVLDQVYSANAYFDRVKRVSRDLKIPDRGGSGPTAAEIRLLAKVVWRMCRQRPRLIGHFFSTMRDCFRNNPAALQSVMKMMSMYLHLGPFAKSVTQIIKGQIATMDAGQWPTPTRVPVPPPEIPVVPPRRVKAATMAAAK